MFKLAEYLPPFPNTTWTLARQAGVTHAVSQVPPDDLDGPGWEFLPLLRMKTRFADAGLTLEVIETGFPWLYAAKLGLPGADEGDRALLPLIRQSRRGGSPGRLLELDGRLQLDANSTTLRTRRSAGHLVRPRADAGRSHTAAGEVSDDTLWESLAALHGGRRARGGEGWGEAGTASGRPTDLLSGAWRASCARRRRCAAPSTWYPARTTG